MKYICLAALLIATLHRGYAQNNYSSKEQYGRQTQRNRSHNWMKACDGYECPPQQICRSIKGVPGCYDDTSGSQITDGENPPPEVIEPIIKAERGHLLESGAPKDTEIIYGSYDPHAGTHYNSQNKHGHSNWQDSQDFGRNHEHHNNTDTRHTTPGYSSGRGPYLHQNQNYPKPENIYPSHVSTNLRYTTPIYNSRHAQNTPYGLNPSSYSQNPVQNHDMPHSQNPMQNHDLPHPRHTTPGYNQHHPTTLPHGSTLSTQAPPKIVISQDPNQYHDSANYFRRTTPGSNPHHPPIVPQDHHNPSKNQTSQQPQGQDLRHTTASPNPYHPPIAPQVHNNTNNHHIPQELHHLPERQDLQHTTPGYNPYHPPIAPQTHNNSNQHHNAQDAHHSSQSHDTRHTTASYNQKNLHHISDDNTHYTTPIYSAQHPQHPHHPPQTHDFDPNHPHKNSEHTFRTPNYSILYPPVLPQNHNNTNKQPPHIYISEEPIQASKGYDLSNSRHTTPSYNPHHSHTPQFSQNARHDTTIVKTPPHIQANKGPTQELYPNLHPSNRPGYNIPGFGTTPQPYHRGYSGQQYPRDNYPQYRQQQYYPAYPYQSNYGNVYPFKQNKHGGYLSTPAYHDYRGYRASSESWARRTTTTPPIDISKAFVRF